MNPWLVIDGPADKLERLHEELVDRYVITPLVRPKQDPLYPLCFVLPELSNWTAFDKQAAFGMAIEILSEVDVQAPESGLRKMLWVRWALTADGVRETSVSFLAETVRRLTKFDCGISVVATIVSNS